LRLWLAQLKDLRIRVMQGDDRLAQIMASGVDAGGPLANTQIRLMAEMQTLLTQFSRREIQIKDLDRGLLDFPAIMAGREVFLCWEEDDDDIEFWHDLDSGFAGREKL
jgi:hypothetical protein